MKAPYVTNCTSEWSITGYNIETEAKYSLAVSKELLKAKMYSFHLFLSEF